MTNNTRKCVNLISRHVTESVNLLLNHCATPSAVDVCGAVGKGVVSALNDGYQICVKLYDGHETHLSFSDKSVLATLSNVIRQTASTIIGSLNNRPFPLNELLEISTTAMIENIETAISNLDIENNALLYTIQDKETQELITESLYIEYQNVA